MTMNIDMEKLTMPDDIYQDDLKVALEAVLKARHGVSPGANIKFELFDEILTFLKRSFEQQEIWALEDLQCCSDMPAEDWIIEFRHVSETHAWKLEDVPCHW
jgi:hypothetical protein